jgi:acyl-coenzyme A synthetase/AMP-(fatty) acid ligase
MKDMKVIFFAGAPLDTETGDIFAPYTTVVPLMGSTEVGAYGMNLPTNCANWQWYELDPASGIKFIQFQDVLYETVFFKHEDAEEAKKQMVFYFAEGEKVYHTKDVWREHPTRQGAWMFAGRTDDFVKLECLTKFNATHIEGPILKDERVKACCWS